MQIQLLAIELGSLLGSMPDIEHALAHLIFKTALRSVHSLIALTMTHPSNNSVLSTYYVPNTDQGIVVMKTNSLP